MELKHFLPMNIRKPQIWENYTYFLKHTNVHGGPVSSDYGVLTEKVSKFLKPRPQPFMQCGSPHQGKHSHFGTSRRGCSISWQITRSRTTGTSRSI